MPEGIPNLDDCWVKERQRYRKVFLSLANYCEIKSWASEHRAAGRIDIALQCEAECEEIYKHLPEWARW
jgi:hypothetical protein